MVADKGRVDALRLQELADELIQQPRGRLRRLALDVMLLAEVLKEVDRLVRLEDFREGDA